MATKYTKEILQDAVRNSKSYAGVLRQLGLKQGGHQTHIVSRIKDLEIDVSHFTGQASQKGRAGYARKASSEILILLPAGSKRTHAYMLRRAMLENSIAHQCAICLLPPFWMNRSITLAVDHVNGNWLDNTLCNLRFLCPNCHSQQTETNSPSKNSSGTNPYTGEVIESKRICECGDKKHANSLRCRSCAIKQGSYSKQEKINWPSTQELLKMVALSNFSATAKALGVSDNAIRNRLNS